METSKTQLVKNTRTDKVTVYWVSYLDRWQRVLLFTQDERVAKKARKVSAVPVASGQWPVASGQWPVAGVLSQLTGL